MEPHELTVRAVLTGMVTGALLTPCNVYKRPQDRLDIQHVGGCRPDRLCDLDGGVQRVGHASLVIARKQYQPDRGIGVRIHYLRRARRPIPALALLTGQTLPLQVLSVWLLAISLLGVVVAAGLRHQLLVRERLHFPSGVVTAETMMDIHAGGAEAGARIRLLGAMAALSAGLKSAVTAYGIGPMAPAVHWKLVTAGGKPVKLTAMNLGFALDPSLLMVGFGAIAGLRIGISILIGATVAWGWLAPMALQLAGQQPARRMALGSVPWSNGCCGPARP